VAGGNKRSERRHGELGGAGEDQLQESDLARGRGDGLFLLVFLELFHTTQRVEARQPVGEEDPVQVVELVLKGARGEARRLDAHLFAMPVESFHDDSLVALDLADPARLAQAALISHLASLGLDDHRVDQAPDLVLVALHDADAERYTDLVRRQAGPGRFEHGFREVVKEPLDGHVNARDFLRFLAQDGMFESQNRAHTSSILPVDRSISIALRHRVHVVAPAFAPRRQVARPLQPASLQRDLPAIFATQAVDERRRRPITRMPSIPSFRNPAASDSAASRAEAAAVSSCASVRVRTVSSANGGTRTLCARQLRGVETVIVPTAAQRRL